MAAEVAHRKEKENANTIIQQLHQLVTHGPKDLDIACAMSCYGYDAVKWAEGHGVLAELISCDRTADSLLVTAIRWYNEAVAAARNALVAQPQLLDKLGVEEMAVDQP
jgi:hypothetical protein